MCKVYTGYHGTSEIEHGSCACTVDNPLAKARGFSLRTDAQTMLYLSRVTEMMSFFHRLKFANISKYWISQFILVAVDGMVYSTLLVDI